MPFYLASPRVQLSSVQRRQQTARIEYVRSAPSSVFVTIRTNHPLSHRLNALENHIHGILPAWMKANTEKKSIWLNVDQLKCNASPVWKDAIQISLPDVTIAFTSDLTEEQSQQLQSWNAIAHDITGKGRLYTARLSIDGFKILDTWENVDFSKPPVGTTIRANEMPMFVALVRHITAVGSALVLMNDSETRVFPSVDFSTTDHTADEYHMSDPSMPKADAQGKVIAESHNAWIGSLCSPDFHLWGAVKDIPAALTHGVFLPFEPNYAGVDRIGLQHFVNDFYPMISAMDDDDDEYIVDLIDSWLDGLSRTPEGDWLAHMMATLRIAKRARAAPFFLIRSGIYEGTVLHSASEFSLIQRKVSLGAMEKDALLVDITAFASHSKSLTGIIGAVGLVGATIDTITSMRQLRGLIFGHMNNGITTAVEVAVKKHLGYLNFNERPLTFNPDTLKIFTESIHPTSPKPLSDQVYLDRTVFFETDDITLNLSMFGRFAPSPSGAGQKHVVVGKSGGVAGDVRPSPSLVKFALKGLPYASQDWRGFLQTATMAFEIVGKVKYTRVFKREDCARAWGIMSVLGSAGLTAQKNKGLVSSGETSQGGRKRREDGQGKDDNAPSKRVRISSFF